MATHLKVYDKASSLRADGSRNYVHPADVAGRFDRLRKVVFFGLIAWLVLLPFVDINGHPAVFLDVQHRRFYLFGSTFNAQDAWLVFFLLSGLGFALIVITALWGRIFCGYMCPQTVFLEGLYRPLERWLEGPRSERLRRNARPLDFDKAWRKAIKQAIFVLFSLAIAHVITAYFVSLPRLYGMMMSRPADHPEAFAWVAAVTGVVYFDFAWFREQMCLVICPYGRLQSILTDDDTLVIGYDVKRGEPRGKKSATNAGDCVDCKRCVVVCPTGIDIRNGLQIDCIGCARCIDACDEVMHKLGRAKGLVRYDSLNGLNAKRKRLWRPRVALYAGLGALGMIVASFAFAGRTAFEANLLRLRDMPPFVMEGGSIRNAFEIHLVNKSSGTALFELRGVPDPRLQYVVAMPRLSLPELSDQRVPVFIDMSRASATRVRAANIEVRMNGQLVTTLRAPLITPN